MISSLTARMSGDTPADEEVHRRANKGGTRPCEAAACEGGTRVIIGAGNSGTPVNTEMHGRANKRAAVGTRGGGVRRRHDYLSAGYYQIVVTIRQYLSAVLRDAHPATAARHASMSVTWGHDSKLLV